MEFCKFLKLTNGENIIVTTDNDCKNLKKIPTLTILNPVQVNSIKMAQGSLLVESYTLQPWIRIAKNDVIEIPTESIVVAVDITSSAEEQYFEFVKDIDEYGEGIEEAAEEDLFDLIDEMGLEEEDDTDDRDNKRKTFH